MRANVPMVDRARPDFGTSMRHLREERGVSLRQIADATKISVSALEALERNDISRLPGGIFSRAFVRAYAVEVGLDPEQTVRDFMVQFPHDSVTAGSPHAPKASYDGDEPAQRSPAMIAAVVAVSVLIGVLLLLTLAASP
jgi:cytoskeletal protein RodZ